jgi:hypothetical protein
LFDMDGLDGAAGNWFHLLADRSAVRAGGMVFVLAR